MAINLHTIYSLDPNDSTYGGERNFLLKVAENNPLRLSPTDPARLRITLDTKGRLVIGYGYDLFANQGTAASELAAVGVALTPEQKAAILNLTSAPLSAVPTALAGLALPSETAATNLLNLTADRREDQLDAFLGANNFSLLQSRERAVLLSMWYQTPAYFRISGNNSKPTNMSRALFIGDRAEVWYEIRYGSSNNGKDGDGVVVRRFAEAQVFGLYNDPDSVGPEEAKQVYRMLQFHRTRIDDYEQQFGGLVGAANIDYGFGTSNQVLGLVNGLIPAEVALFADLRTQYASLSALDPNDYTSTNIYLDPGRDSTDPVGTLRADHRARLDARQFTIPDPITGSTELAFNDILIGEGGDDTLIGGKGDDILIGGDGEDTYVIRSGDGNDRIVDSDGKGKITFEDASGNSYTASLSAYAVSGQANTWTAFAPGGGTITFTRNSPLTITFSDGTSAVIDNYNDGDFDINLLAQPGSDTVPTNVVAGTDFNDNGTEQGGQTYASLTGTADADLIHGFLGDDSMNGGDGEDLLFGDEGRDSMAGAVGDDTLQGGADGDIEYGMDGNDVLVGDVLVNGDLQATMQAAIDSTAAPGTAAAPATTRCPAATGSTR